MSFSVVDSTSARSKIYRLTPTTKMRQTLQGFQTEFKTSALTVDAVLPEVPPLTDCLEAIERKCDFTGDAATLMLSWAIAAHKSEMEVV